MKVVVDEEPLVTMGCRILRSLGYAAGGFKDPKEFIEKVQSDHDYFKLVIFGLGSAFLLLL